MFLCVHSFNNLNYIDLVFKNSAFSTRSRYDIFRYLDIFLFPSVEEKDKFKL